MKGPGRQEGKTIDSRVRRYQRNKLTDRKDGPTRGIYTSDTGDTEVGEESQVVYFLGVAVKVIDFLLTDHLLSTTELT